jgi:arginase
MKMQLIGAALGAGAQDQRTSMAPQALQESGLLAALEQRGLDPEGFTILSPVGAASYLEALPLITEFNHRLAAKVKAAHVRGDFPVVLGGDHSIAMGTWSGVASALSGDLGLIWIDAHMDAHTTQTSETGAVHGMPLSALLGWGDRSMSQIASPKTKIKPQNLCLLGVRSFEKGEARLLKDLGVRVYMMDEIETRGFQTCLREAHHRVTEATERFGVSLDLDAIDPAHFPSVGSPVDQGLRFEAVKRGLLELAADPRLTALEIVEYNPSLDETRLSALMVFDLLASTLLSRRDAESADLRAAIGT